MLRRSVRVPDTSGTLAIAFETLRRALTLRAIYMPAARYITDSNDRAPKLKLDIVPTGKPGEFRIYFQNQPLPKAKITAIAASGWTREIKSDEQGLFVLSLPWKGAYAIEAHHTDPASGVRGEEQV